MAAKYPLKPSASNPTSFCLCRESPVIGELSFALFRSLQIPQIRRDQTEWSQAILKARSLLTNLFKAGPSSCKMFVPFDMKWLNYLLLGHIRGHLCSNVGADRTALKWAIRWLLNNAERLRNLVIFAISVYGGRGDSTLLGESDYVLSKVASLFKETVNFNICMETNSDGQ